MRAFQGSFPVVVVGCVAALSMLTSACTKPADRQEPAGSAAAAPAPGAPAIAASANAANAATAKVDVVKRGEALVRIGGCTDCHTPLAFDPKLGAPVPRRDRFLSGHPEGAPAPKSTASNGEAIMGSTMTAFKLPFGTVYAANLTPDVETGLGSWTEEMFVRAVRTGKHRGEDERPILPPMPWSNLAGQSDEDLHAVWSYLRTLPPVHNKIPAPEVPPPVLAGMKKMNEQMVAQH